MPIILHPPGQQRFRSMREDVWGGVVRSIHSIHSARMIKDFGACNDGIIVRVWALVIPLTDRHMLLKCDRALVALLGADGCTL